MEKFVLFGHISYLCKNKHGSLRLFGMCQGMEQGGAVES